MSSYSNPAIGAVAITGSAQALTQHGRALLITATGDIEFVTSGGDTVEWVAIPVGIHPITVQSIVTGATATGYVLR
jgi:hypothetical protein